MHYRQKETDGHTNRQTDRQADRQTHNRQTDIWTHNRQTHRQTAENLATLLAVLFPSNIMIFKCKKPKSLGVVMHGPRYSMPCSSKSAPHSEMVDRSPKFLLQLRDV